MEYFLVVTCEPKWDSGTSPLSPDPTRKNKTSANDERINNTILPKEEREILMTNRIIRFFIRLYYGGKTEAPVYE